MRHASPSVLCHSICWFVLAISSVPLSSLAAQEVITTPQGQRIVVDGSVRPMDAAAMKALQQKAAAAKQAGPPGGKPPGGDKKAPPNGKGEGEKGEGKEKKELENVKRTAKPPQAPDPSELKVQPDAAGLLKFQFRNQPWPDVLRWLAAVSNRSLDWQELPGDYINLATQRPHTLEEASDMINRALLTRGFTMLEDDDVLMVVKVDSLNPAMVPRVRPSELANLPPHKFVRTSFALTWLLAEEIHEEFGSMLSKNGKLTPLLSTNRLEAIDAAANLRDIHEILEQEQSVVALENLAREFPLTYAKASSVKQQLETFLGTGNSSSGGGPSSSNAMRMMQQQMQQQMQQMQQQMQQAARNKGGAGGASSKKRPDDVYLVANERSNSIIVHAPPNKMAIIASFIARVDVRNENAADFQRMKTRMRVFRLASLGPSELVNSLTAMDVLEPSTRLQVDDENNAIIVYASIADQYLIQSVIERLDGSERSFHVIQLRRLDAESVAGSIRFLMGAEEEEESSSSSRYRSYWDYGYGSRNTKKKEDKMRVGANVRDNQILLRANTIEMQEVQNLLVKLGEIPPDGGRRSTTRLIDASRQPETYEYLQRLKEQWDRISPNPLVIPDASEFESPELEDDASEADEAEGDDAEGDAEKGEGDDKAQEEKGDSPKVDGTNSEQITAAGSGGDVVANRLVSMLRTGMVESDQRDSSEPASAVNSTEPAGPAVAAANVPQQPVHVAPAGAEADSRPPAEPVAIAVDQSGNLVIQSNDTAALDRLEEMMQINRPPRRPYDLFKVKYARASWVALNLEDYFDQEEEDGNSSRFFPYFFGGFGDDKKKDKTRQLGDRPPLRFIYDNDTNSIVVQGADDVDRQTIKELIKLWDVPEPVDEDEIRFTKLMQIKHSNAESIVTTLKDAYRDLLSANDKAFQQKQGNGDDNGESKRGGQSQGVQGGGLNFTFRGKLSLGVDQVTNSILVSAEGQPLLDLVCDMIEQLDVAAQPQGDVQVYQLSPGVNGSSLEKALRAMLQSPSSRRQSGKNGGNQQQQQQQAQQAMQAQLGQ